MASIIELYQFVIGENYYWQTSAPKSVVYDGRTYESHVLKRDSVISSGEISHSGMKLYMSRENPIVKALAANPFVTGSVSILSKATKSDVYLALWSGRTAALTFSDNSADLTCESLLTCFKRQTNYLYYQFVCRHALYGTACAVLPSDYVRYATIKAIIDKSTIELNDIVTDNDYYVGGYIVINNVDRRMILTHIGSTITITPQLTANIKLGANLRIYPGCNHTTEHCKAKFNNMINYGGFPYIPDRNPFSSLGANLVGI